MVVVGYWVRMSKMGASSQEERIKLIESTSKLFNLTEMTLIADWEYVGKEWFKYLISKQINFVIRIKWLDYFQEVEQAQQGLNKKLTYGCCIFRKGLAIITSKCNHFGQYLDYIL
jgi:hypothetical protein